MRRRRDFVAIDDAMEWWSARLSSLHKYLTDSVLLKVSTRVLLTEQVQVLGLCLSSVTMMCGSELPNARVLRFC
jgi:hypothetical protein